MKILLWALFVVVPAVASADEPEGQGYGLGLKSCAQFASEYKAQPTIAEGLYFAWAEGFLSGLNLAAVGFNLPARSLASVDVASAKVEIRSYCDAHPLAPYYGAVVTIYNKLPRLPRN
jgi:hypothetical protein